MSRRREGEGGIGERDIYIDGGENNGGYIERRRGGRQGGAGSAGSAGTGGRSLSCV